MTSNETESKKSRFFGLGRTLNALGAIKNAPYRYGLMKGKQLSSSCKAGIYDSNAKTWAIRFDVAHKGAKYPHININHKLTGVRDPHVKIPGAVVKSGEVLSTVSQGIGTTAFFAAICNDTYSIFKSWQNDHNESNSFIPGKNVARTGTEVGLRWTGGILGSMLGGKVLGTAGTIIGFPFGPVGVMVGSAGFTLIGAVGGGFYGVIKGENIAKSIFNK
ncbi:hypothetical protein L9F63_001531 [Diploptera punctata]|uniref:Uncharacterized protein n=1 Tax=Diploptera punctata TaxID=6984 RepID=A0AAD8EJ72_DIPPU|nr:hypothetical protein L9F63_001531 [Diploptera punctata]